MAQKPLISSTARFALPIYFAIAFGVAWGCWGLAIAVQYKVISFPVATDVLQTLGAFAPLLAALVVTMHLGTTRALLSRGLRWKVGLSWYLFALFVPALLMLTAIGLYIALGGSAPNFPRLWQWPLVAVNFVAVLVVGGPLGEEFGWRGFALPAMLVRYSPLRSSIGLGVIWTCWHLPLFWLNGTPQQQIPFGLFFLMTVALSVLFTWLFNNTHGSVLLCMLFHAATNTWSGPLRILPEATGSQVPYAISIVLTWVLAIFLFTRKYWLFKAHNYGKQGVNK